MDKLMAVGDSVVWGQGLAHDAKFVSLVSQRLTGSDLPEQDIKGRSGAIIGISQSARPPISESLVPNRTARHEVPHSSPTINEQVATIPEHEAAAVDVLILDGGINDVNIRNALDPGTEHNNNIYNRPVGDETDKDRDIEDLVHGYCYEDVKTLLKRARANFPNAIIVALGYYPILSDESSTADIVAAGTALGGAFGGVGAVAGGIATAALAEDVITNALYLHRRQLHWIRRAVAELDADPAYSGPGILFAQPGFNAENSMLADNSWLYEPGELDDQAQIRVPACETVYDEFSDTVTESTCMNAATGHPNHVGAKAYADDMATRVRAHSERSIRNELIMLANGGTPVNTRETLEGYGLDVATGLRACFNHTIIDCIEITVETGDNGTDSTITFGVNETDQWELDTAWVNEFEADSLHTFTIDPVLEGRSQSLRLADVNELYIKKDGEFDWELDQVRVRINGRTVLDTSVNVTLSGTESWIANHPT